MRVDLNADVGEWASAGPVGQDPALMPHITSANVACGFHAGDPRRSARCVAQLTRAGIKAVAEP